MTRHVSLVTLVVLLAVTGAFAAMGGYWFAQSQAADERIADPHNAIECLTSGMVYPSRSFPQCARYR